jgi:transposase-like protein
MSATQEPDPVVAEIERRRTAGQSIAQACRDMGVSTSTYYRRRKSAPSVAPTSSPTRPERATIVAPHYWNQAFQHELADSYVRREHGRHRAPRAAPAPRAQRLSPQTHNKLGALYLSALAAPFGQIAAFFRASPTASAEDGWRVAAGPAALAAILLPLVAAGCAWIVALAADPAATGKTGRGPDAVTEQAGPTATR